ncbi:hypothetical protein [Corynebacterium renale]|uniref:Secreted protein n=2 Tax=Corynebacterium renale TaxID=1724 RepID=A0A2A9DNQ1_9CORY|nr:hypothetical protein ATK06_0673 [Corynebacterium renale]SQI22974.1 putative secreted protein [Corynebacterium renale]
MVRMKRILLTAALAGGLALAPATAHADVVDKALAALPAGPISCDQANRYWTNEADYNNKVAQANALAAFHPRGGEVRAALARVDEAANRCGLKGGNAAPGAGAGAPAAAPGAGAGAPAPAPAPAAPAAAIDLSGGQPSVTVNVAGQTIALPDVLTILRNLIAQLTGQLNLGSSF